MNGTFARVYEVLGKETGKNIAPPQWSVDSTGLVLGCTLRPAAAARFYSKTIDELAAELEAYVVGTGYRVSAVENRIEVGKE